MEYFVFLLFNLTDVDPKFNAGVCRQYFNYVETEDRNEDSKLWENCRSDPECSRYSYEIYKNLWTCPDDEYYEPEEDPIPLCVEPD